MVTYNESIFRHHYWHPNFYPPPPLSPSRRNTVRNVNYMTFWKRWVVVVVVAVTVGRSGGSLNTVSFYPGYFFLTPSSVDSRVITKWFPFNHLFLYFFKVYFYYFTKGLFITSEFISFHLKYSLLFLFV